MKGRHMKAIKDNSGKACVAFTLIELLVVIAIIAILAASLDFAIANCCKAISV